VLLLQVRVLQCVSATIDIMGDRVRPHLATITTALPKVWTVVSQRSNDGTGGMARLHSALMATIIHLIGRLGRTAMEDQHIGGVLAPLLEHATDMGECRHRVC
jgi:hypothetical protein